MEERTEDVVKRNGESCSITSVTQAEMLTSCQKEPGCPAKREP